MPRKITLGYIVISGSYHPLTWSESEQRFYRSGGNRPKASIYQREWYRHLRRCIKKHNRTLEEQFRLYNFSEEYRAMFTNLRVVRLIEP